MNAADLISTLIECQNEALDAIERSELPTDKLRLVVLGKQSELANLTRGLSEIPKVDITRVGIVLKEVKSSLEHALEKRSNGRNSTYTANTSFVDVTAPGIKPPIGHLHIVTQAISEITRIFEKIGFTRVRHPEVDWDWYAFESLNMPQNHPARDEWETFFIENPGNQSLRPPSRNPNWIPGQARDDKSKIVLTPHTSNGQVREMEKGKLPIRMINIAKCYRRQIDVSHTPMFHQFEGMYVDKDVSITHLKGVLDYFATQFFGPERKTRLRPYHFQFTEPSFEVDITCDICAGTGILEKNMPCRLCKSGWLELGGAGMVHPNVLNAGKIDSKIYSGFAFGWGIERTSMMKSGTKLDDVRLLYSNDVRFLEQF